VSAKGKVYALDSSNGNVLWSKLLGNGWTSEVGGAEMSTRKLAIVKGVGEGEGRAEAVLVVERRARNVSVLELVKRGRENTDK
jgi:ER membrane protein complex subunit 1